MAFKFPWTNFHELNFDWMLKKWKEIYDKIPTKLSQLINDKGFVNAGQAAAAAPVQSVNGATGDVIITVPPPEMFECQYGVTTWAAIDNARTEGLVPYVNYFGTLYMFTETAAADGHYFSAFPKDQKHKMIKCAGDNTWSLLEDVVKELYWCTYGTTTTAEIAAAISDGKMPVCFYTNSYYILGNAAAADNYYFARVQTTAATSAVYYLRCYGTGSWQHGGHFIARLDSPTFTGTPAAPTATAGTNTTQIATTAFVQGELATAMAGYIPLDGDANNLNPVDDLDDFTTGIAVFHNTAGTPIANFPWTSGPDFALVVTAGNAAIGILQIAYDSQNSRVPRMRVCGAGSWTAWDDVKANAYNPGDTFDSSTKYIVMNGYITGGSQDLFLDLTLPKSVDYVTSATIDSMVGTLRGVRGYLNSDASEIDIKASYNVTVNYLTGNHIRLDVSNTNGFTNVDNNTPVSVYAKIKVTFA